MESKRLGLSPVVPVQRMNGVGVRAGNQFNGNSGDGKRGRQKPQNKSFKDVFEQEAWKYDLPAYDYRVKSGKRMSLPKRDDSLLGGYANTGRMTMESARSYMEAKAAEDAKKARLQQRRNIEFNPFNGLVEDEEENEFI